MQRLDRFRQDHNVDFVVVDILKPTVSVALHNWNAAGKAAVKAIVT
jgi:hypothetical protein